MTIVSSFFWNNVVAVTAAAHVPFLPSCDLPSPVASRNIWPHSSFFGAGV